MFHRDWIASRVLVGCQFCTSTEFGLGRDQGFFFLGFYQERWMHQYTRAQIRLGFELHFPALRTLVLSGSFAVELRTRKEAFVQSRFAHLPG